jgi:DNA polymerase-3 subunit alpha
VQLAASLQLPVVATHPVQFMTPDDFTAHEARVCIAEGELLANPRRTRKFTTDQYFKTQDEMARCSPISRRRCRTRSKSPSAAT